jgi:hypothetical protein
MTGRGVPAMTTSRLPTGRIIIVPATLAPKIALVAWREGLAPAAEAGGGR